MGEPFVYMRGLAKYRNINNEIIRCLAFTPLNSNYKNEARFTVLDVRIQISNTTAGVLPTAIVVRITTAVSIACPLRLVRNLSNLR